MHAPYPSWYGHCRHSLPHFSQIQRMSPGKFERFEIETKAPGMIEETANTQSLAEQWERLGASHRELTRVFRSFNSYAEEFRKESEAHER